MIRTHLKIPILNFGGKKACETSLEVKASQVIPIAGNAGNTTSLASQVVPQTVLQPHLIPPRLRILPTQVLTPRTSTERPSSRLQDTEFNCFCDLVHQGRGEEAPSAPCGDSQRRTLSETFKI